VIATSPFAQIAQKAIKQKATPFQLKGTWQDIYKNYTGRNDVPDFMVNQDPAHPDPNSEGGLSSNDGNWASITPATMSRLESWKASRLSNPTLRDVEALTILIHEATHMRRSLPGWNHPDWSKWPKGQEPLGPGFKTWDDEHQAQALAANLVPDAMQRFFGVQFGSKLGQLYWSLAKKAASVWGYGVDPANPLGPPNQNWQDVSKQVGEYQNYTKSLAPTSMPGW
jgi:hypothetical protein